jgi:hypothetical protein
MLGLRKPSKYTISEPDLQGALTHLRSLHFGPNLPMSWDRKWLIDEVREKVGSHPKINDTFGVAPGVFATIKPFGVDLLGHSDPEHRLQVWLSTRGWGTDPTQVVEL